MSKLNPEFCDVVVPAAGTHAIDRVCLGFQWGEPLDQALMKEISLLLTGKALQLPRKIQFSSGAVMKSEEEDLPETLKETDSELMAIVFDDNTEKDSPADKKDVELVIQRDGLLFAMQNSVPGWVEAKERAKEVTSIAFEVIGKHRSIASVGLQVSNSFLIASDDVGMERILRVDSEYLPKKIFTGNNFWKLDDDYFFGNESDSAYLNLDVSLSPFEEGRKLSIATLQRHIPEAGFIDDLTLVFEKVESLYKENVSLVRSLIHDNVCGLIGMKGSGR
ncbi:hypothetical protein [Pseudomonas ogarae]|uniref:hypothetical protein n=1 Tax=Pseudomonas ogarae (strain DSM 112162 / CECT 30235 / F113) TaxID=1114970 RepID=UPI00194E7106|nr:hypothetical protein [Pseudomonas ogarae]